MLLFRVKAQLPLPLPRQKRDAAERVHANMKPPRRLGTRISPIWIGALKPLTRKMLLRRAQRESLM